MFETDRKKTALFIAVIVLMSIVSYANSFDVPFQFDDKGYVVDNPVVKDFSYFMEPAKVDEVSFNSDVKYNFRVRYVGYLSFYLNYLLGGTNVFGYHLVNLATHILNALLVYVLLIFTFRTPRLVASTMGKNARGIAFLSALLFTVHPVQTEAVTYVTQRFASLEAFFYLLSLFLYVKWRLSVSEPGGLARKGQLLYLGCLVSAVLAMKTKETAFTLPVVVALYEYAFLTGNWKRRLLYLVPLALTMLIVPLTVMDFRMPLGEALSEATRTQLDITRGAYLFTEFRVLVTYLRLLLLPMNQDLDYDYPLYDSFFTPPVYISFVFLGIIIFSVVYFLFRFRRGGGAWLGLAAFGGLWFFITLSVESSFIALEDVIFEHRLYLPSVGVFALLGGSAFVLLDRIRSRALQTVFLSSLFLIVLVFSVSTTTRNTVWGSEISLWQDVVKKSPGKARGYNNLGLYYKKEGMYRKAVECYVRALEIKPDFVDALTNRGNAYLHLKRYIFAIQDFTRALRINPYSAEAFNNRGVAYGEVKQYQKAINDYNKAIQYNPANMAAYNNRGNAYMSMKQYERAVSDYSRAIELDPELAEAYDNRGFVYMTYLGEKLKACDDWRIACRLGICSNYELAIRKDICK